MRGTPRALIEASKRANPPRPRIESRRCFQLRLPVLLGLIAAEAVFIACFWTYLILGLMP